MKSDVDIQKDVMDEIGWEPSLDPSKIGVAVKDGIVTLSGQVDSFFKKQSAERAAKRVRGVKAIAEDIQIGLSPSNKRSDADIAAAVLNALKWHTAVQEDTINVKVENGIVVLDGEVDWEFQRRNAIAAIENLTGVVAITNLITVKPRNAPSDTAENIISAIRRNSAVDEKKVKVNVEGNKVILTGTVNSFAEKQDVENAAWSAPGVLDVDNKLTIDLVDYAFYE